MQNLPFHAGIELEGWVLFWAQLQRIPCAEEHLAGLRDDVVKRARARLTLDSLAGEPAVAALRRLFKAAGCDPSRYRPSSEALLRRILKGEDLPAIHPLVDLNNCLSAELAVTCCVMAQGSFEPPMHFRAGRPRESYESLKGPFNLEGKPLLVDTQGPLDAPITGSQRAKVTSQTEHAWLVAYLPHEAVSAALAAEALLRLVEAAPVVRVLLTAATGIGLRH
jgi:DNA/RNA-binding domain of Phe-tRNA-synthetase-like protein